MTRTIAVFVAFLASVGVASGQETDVASVTRALRVDLAELRRVERALMPAPGASSLARADDDLLARRNRARADAERALDLLVAAAATGRPAIRDLASDFPEADVVRRAEIRAAFRANAPAEALELVERLRITMPRDTQMVRWRADACEALGRSEDALRARQAYWELAPEDAEGWRTLVYAHERAGSLARLRESVGRIRLLRPESRIVREQEIEILHRLRRYAEAARVAATGGAPR